ncbi:hypothetical protein FZW96_14100 [Bacillus sp. BGMRC 2118]|nr:hypothetical protein FZW96_14100 [Bacillus sp. BGMRC 2118]
MSQVTFLNRHVCRTMEKETMTMEKVKTIVVVGGGYAGINLIAALSKEFLQENLKIILIDKNSYHFKKVKLFKAIVNESSAALHTPLTNYCRQGVEFIQGELMSNNHEVKQVSIRTEDGTCVELEYDKLVIAIGSVVREVSEEQGGIALTNVQNAKRIRQHILEEISSSKDPLRLAIVGGGITGIETAMEIRAWLNDERKNEVELFLINHKQRLMTEAPSKISEKLENRITQQGIHVIQQKKAEQFVDKTLKFSDKTELEVDVCIWTLGLRPHPSLRELDLPLNEEGRIKVDSWYRIQERENLYAIGDCVQVTEDTCGKISQMSCKEAISQAQRLSKIIKADCEGYNETPHQIYPDLLCIGLGPNDGFVWAKKWGIHFVLTGRLAERIREYTWNVGSLHQ